MVSIAPTPLYLPSEEANKIFKSPIPQRRDISSCSNKQQPLDQSSQDTSSSSVITDQSQSSYSNVIATSTPVNADPHRLHLQKSVNSPSIEASPPPPSRRNISNLLFLNNNNNNNSSNTSSSSSSSSSAPSTAHSLASNLLRGKRRRRNIRPFDSQQSNLVKEAYGGLTQYSPKISVGNGLGGGVYFLKNAAGENVGVFKPLDEENGIELSSSPMGQGLKNGTLVGEGGIKEVVAYFFDQLHGGFFNVPTTALVQVKHPLWSVHSEEGNDNNNNNSPSSSLSSSSANAPSADTMLPKTGSLQRYIPFDGTAEEIGCSKFSVNDIHRIGLLDCLLFNCDRHSGNILVVYKDEDDEEGEDKEKSINPFKSNNKMMNNSQYELIPIDHSLCLPSSDSLSDSWFDWINFPQAKIPFSEETKQFILDINIDRDIQKISEALPELRHKCLETLKITTIFVQESIRAGFSLYQIGLHLSRFFDLYRPCALESIVQKSMDKFTSSSSVIIPTLTANNQISTTPTLLFNQSFWNIYQQEIKSFFSSTNQ